MPKNSITKKGVVGPGRGIVFSFHPSISARGPKATICTRVMSPPHSSTWRCYEKSSPNIFPNYDFPYSKLWAVCISLWFKHFAHFKQSHNNILWRDYNFPSVEVEIFRNYFGFWKYNNLLPKRKVAFLLFFFRKIIRQKGRLLEILKQFFQCGFAYTINMIHCLTEVTDR